MDIHPKFFSLTSEKRLSIINAALEVFAKNEYSRASTDDIARKAGISKGLLFHYFKNKKSLYLYIYNYALELTTNFVVDEKFQEITDFFDLISYSSHKKAKLVAEYPYLMDFVVRSFFSEKEEVSKNLQEEFQRQINNIFHQYMAKLDLHKFKEEINPFEIYRMLIWMSDGYLNEKKRMGEKLDVEEMQIMSDKWLTMLKQISYKEEYL